MNTTTSPGKLKARKAEKTAGSGFVLLKPQRTVTVYKPRNIVWCVPAVGPTTYQIAETDEIVTPGGFTGGIIAATAFSYPETVSDAVMEPSITPVEEPQSQQADQETTPIDPEILGWLKLSESAFDFWDNEDDAIYDNL